MPEQIAIRNTLLNDFVLERFETALLRFYNWQSVQTI